MRQFHAIAEGHAEVDRLREARFVHGVRVAMNGTADQVDDFLSVKSGGGDFATVEELLKGAP